MPTKRVTTDFPLVGSPPAATAALGKVWAFTVALASVAERDGTRNDDEGTAVHLEILTKEELEKVSAALTSRS